jgi:hypothetical protein
MEGQQKNLFGLPDFSDTPREKKKVVDSTGFWAAAAF